LVVSATLLFPLFLPLSYHSQFPHIFNLFFLFFWRQFNFFFLFIIFLLQIFQCLYFLQCVECLLLTVIIFFLILFFYLKTLYIRKWNKLIPTWSIFQINFHLLIFYLSFSANLNFVFSFFKVFEFVCNTRANQVRVYYTPSFQMHSTIFFSLCTKAIYVTLRNIINLRLKTSDKKSFEIGWQCYMGTYNGQ